mmetsp:Transcript_21368/g.43130  ORF Transcript_21368/g.43130 Transcript_21368/m.43130 type:complete len:172 (-) Transcript_21368:201-716(-)|eukprot:CAMPEP_0183305546 /NCGR_PEP_ID=MMETSP0160_2-20130417/10234_1 /TAXON_ID=2839 ORGANISM="Odontella Sinensis, Strain Grunow 1884" /NCGR_SAMPLE_ID=MMETSP0160_2 /ASSEMBLY_ACC=CAM_ASM_000250 /LENGTH=171 /DNA_ID=CAMNT_0025468757 /DNA_START=76 /DNA_END=591 /DNA_ORIENTATION=+
MKQFTALVAALVAAACVFSDAYTPNVKPTARAAAKPAFDVKHAAATAFTAATLASNVFLGAPPAQANDAVAPFSSSVFVAEKVTREGLYGDYTVDLVQEVDDAKSTFKGAKETKSKKGKYTALLAILVVGSFIIPMAQYFWYVKDDDSSDKFFNQVPEPEPEPPKKKGWFN